MDLKSIEKKIQFYQKEVSLAEQESSKLEGAKEALVKRLQENFNITTLSEITELLEKLKKEKEVVSVKLERKIKELEDKYIF